MNSFLKTVCSQRTLSGKLEKHQFSELFPQQTSHACSLFHPPMPLPGNELYHLRDSTYPLYHQNTTLPSSGGLEYLSVVITAAHTAHHIPWTHITIMRLHVPGDDVNRHNRLRDILLESCHHACLSPKLEAGCGLGHEGHRTRPADILVPNWKSGRPCSVSP